MLTVVSRPCDSSNVPINELDVTPSRHDLPASVPKMTSDDLFALPPDEVVDIALCALRDASIEFIEQRARLYRRMGVPVLVKDYSFAVKDEDIRSASQVLLKLGLPLARPCSTSEGEYSSQAVLCRITADQSLAFQQCIALIPASFNDLDFTEVTYAPSEFRSASPLRCPYLPVSLEPAVYASLMRAVAHYRYYSDTWIALVSDLQELIDYHLLREKNGYVDPEDEEYRNSPEVLERQRHAIATIHEWNCTGVWRTGEEWMGDALLSVLQGLADIEYLPNAS